jgi:hypothetical protein
MANVAVRAYTAGIIDGEGCIQIKRIRANNGKTYHGLAVAVTNTDRSLLEWLAATWNAVSVTPNPTSGIRDKPQWIVRWHGSVARELLEAIRPYLIVKRRQADLAISFHSELIFDKRTAWNLVTDEVVAARESAYAAMRALNRKGLVA